MINGSDIPLERHPWAPFIPAGARVLIMGTFPPQPHRWAMDFYYPNRTNDFWRIMGLLFLGNPDALYSPATRQFDLVAIKALCRERGIALSDTGRAVRRLAGNASDKFLEIVEPADLPALRALAPGLRAIATTGEKAADTLASLTATDAPRMGQMIVMPDGLEIWRMPSTSRAYPAPLAKKAEYYGLMFSHLNIL